MSRLPRWLSQSVTGPRGQLVLSVALAVVVLVRLLVAGPQALLVRLVVVGPQARLVMVGPPQAEGRLLRGPPQAE